VQERRMKIAAVPEDWLRRSLPASIDGEANALRHSRHGTHARFRPT
jgi:hypothetical protein